MILRTKYTEIHYEEEELLIWSRRITYGNRLFRKLPVEDRVDKLFVRVQTLLDCPSMKGLKIRLHRRVHMLRPKGYYSHYNKTVHLCIRDGKNKVLAHELGHAVFDNFLGRRAPGKMGEIMAKYVAVRI